MKKIIALLLVAVMALSLVACADSGSGDGHKVAMVTDYGDITDQSFNQTTWEAVVAFGKQNNIATKYYTINNVDLCRHHYFTGKDKCFPGGNKQCSRVARFGAVCPGRRHRRRDKGSGMGK